ncbi:MAG: STAS domain-containing protein [SAR324 cluster bacterium]|nr:STAS domain-containing protein [SAR324 cluster bacterium]
MSVETRFIDSAHQQALVTLKKVSEMHFSAVMFEVGHDLIEKNVRHIIVDLLDMVYIPMEGLGTLNSLCQDLSAIKGRLALVCHNANIKMLLRSTTLAKVIEIHDNLDDAMQIHEDQLLQGFMDQLNDEQKFWYLKAVANIIVADGEISPGEIAVAESLFAQIELESHKIAEIQNIFQSLTKVKLEPLRIDKTLGLTMLQTLTLIAIADNSLMSAEENVIREITHCFGFAPTSAEEMINWGSEQLKTAQTHQD